VSAKKEVNRKQREGEKKGKWCVQPYTGFQAYRCKVVEGKMSKENLTHNKAKTIIHELRGEKLIMDVGKSETKKKSGE